MKSESKGHWFTSCEVMFPHWHLIIYLKHGFARKISHYFRFTSLFPKAFWKTAKIQRDYVFSSLTKSEHQSQTSFCARFMRLATVAHFYKATEFGRKAGSTYSVSEICCHVSYFPFRVSYFPFLIPFPFQSLQLSWSFLVEDHDFHTCSIS